MKKETIRYEVKQAEIRLNYLSHVISEVENTGMSLQDKTFLLDFLYVKLHVTQKKRDKLVSKLEETC